MCPWSQAVTLLLTPRSPRYLEVPVASVTKVQRDSSRAGRRMKSRFLYSLNFGYFKENDLALNSVHQPSLRLGSGMFV